VSKQVPRFPPPVAARLQEPSGDVTVHVTPGAWTRRESDFRWLLMSVEDQPVRAHLILDAEHSLRFYRTAPGLPMLTAKTQVDALMEERSWVVELRWSEESVEVSARAASSVP
jgi:hypothetical protein